ncbi:MAG: hypothetical protein E7662_09020 [Ruminococcaceae bacterium]|nr:hypothetical protein [Oscillospiraceae bacterium]
MKRIICLLLSALFVLSAAACGTPDDQPTDDTETTAPVSEDTTTAPPETTPLDLLKDLNFDGADFRITYPANLEGSMEDAYINASEENGDILNDSSYQRYREVEELLGVKFKYFPQSARTVLKEVNSTLIANEDAYDFIIIRSAQENFISQIQTGVLYNLLDIPHMNLDASYYYSTVNEQFVIHDKLFFGFSNYMNNGNMPLHMVFNKTLMTSMNMTLPYDAIFSGDWTFDLFHSYVSGASADLNGDGTLDPNDRFGYVNNTLTNYMVFGFDVQVVKRTEKGDYVPALKGEHLINSLQLLVDFIKNDPDIYTNKTINPDGPHLFMRGNALFTTTGTSMLDLRSIDSFDFGIAPYPKYDENQKEYTGNLVLNPFGVPAAATRVDMIGAVIEALSIISAEKMVPVYLDVYIERKILRDKESVEIMRMMMENVSVDVTRYYDFADGAITPRYLVSKITDPSAVVSYLQSIEASSTAKANDFFKVFFE